MADLLKGIGTALGKVFQPSTITLDDAWDQINRGFMFTFCSIFGMIVFIRQNTGNVIACNGFTKFKKDFADDFCWTQGLYTLRDAYSHSRENVPYPGIMPEDVPPCMPYKLVNGGTVNCPDPEDILEPERAFHLWYQWVPYYFFLVGAAFYVPHLIYKHLGLSDLKPLVQMLHNTVETEGEMDGTTDKAAHWLYMRFCSLYGSGMMKRHMFGIAVILTKVMYVIIGYVVFELTAQMFETGSFWRYGFDWARASVDVNGTRASLSRVDPTEHIRDVLFPKIVACEIRRWGTTGMEEENGMCVVAPNVINQYLFLLLWFMLVFVCASNVLSIFVGLFNVVFTNISYKRLLIQSMLEDENDIHDMYFNIGTSGRVTLMILGTSIRPRVFELIVRKLIDKMKPRMSEVGELRKSNPPKRFHGFSGAGSFLRSRGGMPSPCEHNNHHGETVPLTEQSPPPPRFSDDQGGSSSYASTPSPSPTPSAEKKV